MTSIAKKMIEGLRNQGWELIGHGGSWAGAIRPLEAYIQRKVERAVKAEREACAKVCEDDVRTWSHPGSITREECAAAIRARSKA